MQSMVHHVVKHGLYAGLPGGSTTERFSALVRRGTTTPTVHTKINLMKFKNTCAHRIATAVLAIGAGALVTQAAAPTTPQGLISGNAWTGIGGTNVTDLTGIAAFPDSPDEVIFLPYFEWNATGTIDTAPGDWGDDYGSQIIGYFYPPATEAYYFAICADDNADLYLSTDDDPANRKLIAQETDWSNPREYLTSGGASDLNAKLSDLFTGTEWPNREADGGIILQANQPYYIEALHKEEIGGDNLSVSVLGAGINGNLPIPGQYLSSDMPNGPLVIIEDPQSQTVEEGFSVTFRVQAEGTPPYTYQWTKGGTDITDATGQSYTINPVLFADNGATFACTVTGGSGSATSADAVLTVNQDTTPPTLVRASQGDEMFMSVIVHFSELVTSPTATTSSNYTLDNGATVSAAALSTDGLSVTLTTSRLAEDSEYTLTVNNVEDLVGNAIAPDSQITLRTFVFTPGAIVHKKYDNVDNDVGLDPNNLFNDPRFGNAPDRVDIMTMWEYPANGATRVPEDPVRNYSDTLEGYFIPPATGDYVFLTAGADRWWLYLSTDDDPANKKLIAAEPGGWSDPRGWTQMHSGSLDSRRSDLCPVSEWPELTISLTEGQRYYMLEVHHDPSWCGADDFSATYIMEGDPDPADGSAPTITGSVVGAYVDLTALPPVFTSPTANSQTIVEAGDTETLSVATTGAQTYQWQWNGIDIAGATSTDYVITDAKPTDSGQYWCIASNQSGSATSPLFNIVVTATGVFAIEAEDFDYDSGQHLPGASAMPYTGGAYDGLSAVHGVDYNSANSSADSPDYRGGAVIAEGTAAPMSDESGGDIFVQTRMGEWDMVVDYKIGWVDGGDWGNYTRTFPSPALQYWVFAAAAYDGTSPDQLSGSLGLVTEGVGTDIQTVQPLGNFSAPGTAGWSRNSLVAMTDEAGAIATVEIGGLSTIRWGYDSGDAQYLVFVPATVADEVVITDVTREGNSVTVTWTGGGEAEVTDDLNGTWTATGDTDGSYTATIQPGNAYLRIRRD